MLSIKANEYMDNANKVENKWSLFNNIKKYQSAATLYVKAGNLYKVDNNYSMAATAYLKAVELYKKSFLIFLN